jgi:hypothetical protein
VVATYSGRVVLNWIIFTVSCVEARAWSPDPAQRDRNLGQIEVGQAIRDTIRAADPELWVKLEVQRRSDLVELAAAKKEEK